MDKIILILVVVGVIGSSSALECYLCVGSIDGVCAHAQESEMTKQPCKEITDNSTFHMPTNENVTKINEENAGKKIVAHCMEASATNDGQTLFSRSCAYIYEGVDLCKYVAHLVDKLEFCKSCDSDLCNKDKK